MQKVYFLFGFLQKFYNGLNDLHKYFGVLAAAVWLKVVVASRLAYIRLIFRMVYYIE